MYHQDAQHITVARTHINWLLSLLLLFSLLLLLLLLLLTLTAIAIGIAVAIAIAIAIPQWFRGFHPSPFLTMARCSNLVQVCLRMPVLEHARDMSHGAWLPLAPSSAADMVPVAP